MKTNNILVLGAGRMSYAIVHDLVTYEPQYQVKVVDNSQSALDGLAGTIPNERISTELLDISDSPGLKRHFADSQLVIGATTYDHNLDLAELAIETGTNWIDLGGNHDIVHKQFKLDKKARNAHAAIIPDCGLAPGMVNVIGGDMAKRLTSIDEMHFRVGGLPQFPKPPLFYGLCFSPEGLANEYSEPCRVLDQSMPYSVAPLSGWEKVYFGPPYGSLEAFSTSGGVSTMIETFAYKVQTLDYKTLRYIGHQRNIKLLLDLGLFDKQEVELSDGTKVVPRKLTSRLLERMGEADKDVVVLKAWAVGSKSDQNMRIDYRMIDEWDNSTNLSAMARTTGFSAAIIARMILDGRITENGVLRQELSVPAEEYFLELDLRSIKIEISETIL